MSKLFRLIVCGSRDFSDESHLNHILDRIAEKHDRLLIIEGCARGADQLAERWAAENHVPVEHYPADWNRYGRRAGFVRNEAMARATPDAVVAFYRDPAEPSRGTQMMVRIAAERGIPTWVPALPDYQF